MTSAELLNAVNANADYMHVSLSIDAVHKLGLRPVFIYIILFNDSDYAYVGQALDVPRRFASHAKEALYADNFKSRVWRKHGVQEVLTTNLIGCYAVIDSTGSIVPVGRTSRHDIAHLLEHSVAKYCSELGYKLCNATGILRDDCKSYAFAGAIEVAQHRSSSLHAYYSNEEARQRQADLSIAAWQNPTSRQNIMTAQRIAQKRPDCIAAKSAAMKAVRNSSYAKARQAAINAFRYLHGSNIVYAYKNGYLPAWQSFVIDPETNTATFFVWDTRKVLKQCNAADLPAGYVRVYDSYEPLDYADTCIAAPIAHRRKRQPK